MLRSRTWGIIVGIALGTIGAVPVSASLPPPTGLTAQTLDNPRMIDIGWINPPGTTQSVVTLTNPYTKRVIRTTNQRLRIFLPSGGTWTVTVRGRSSAEESPTADVTLTTTIPAPTDAPTGVTVTSFSGRLLLRWTGSAHGDKTRVTWNDPTTNQPHSLVVATPILTLSNLVNNQSYQFELRYLNETGIGPPTIVTATPTPARLTAAATGLTATPLSRTSATLSWAPTPNATFYAVYVGSSTNLATLKATALPRIATSTTLVVHGLTAAVADARFPSPLLVATALLLAVGLVKVPSRRAARFLLALPAIGLAVHGYTVWAAVQSTSYAIIVPGNLNGLGSPSAPIPLPVTSLPPTEAPTVTVTNAAGGGIVAWTAVPSATDYSLYYSPGTTFNSATATRLAHVTSPYTITGLPSGATYMVAVAGSTDGGEGPLSPPQPLITMAPPSSAPTVTVTTNTTTATLAWTAITGASDYVIHWQPGSVFDPNAGSERITSNTNDTITGLTPDTTYTIAVRARNAAGTGPWSNPSVIHTPILFQGVSAPTGSLLTPRYGYALVKLLDGRPLIIGGVNYASGLLASVEIYSPATGQWSSVSSMSYPRGDHTATVLNDGTVLVVGGAGGTASQTVERFNPSTNTWIFDTDLPIPIGGNRLISHSATLLTNGSVLIAGGALSSGTALATTLVYTPAPWPNKGTWTIVGPLSKPRAYHAAVRLLSGHVVVMGGTTNFLSREASAERFDPLTNAWVPLPPMKNRRQGHGAALLTDGRVLVAGGYDSNSINDAEIYSPAYNYWIPIPGMQSARSDYAISTLLDGRVLISGGYGNTYKSISAVEIYNPSTNGWSPVAQMTIPRSDHQSVVMDDGRVLIPGGNNNGTSVALTQVEIYQ